MHEKGDKCIHILINKSQKMRSNGELDLEGMIILEWILDK